MPVLPAQQLVDGNAQLLSGNVMQSDIDGRDRSCKRAAALEVLTAVHLLPQRRAVHGILADQELTIVLNNALYAQLAPGESSLTPPVNALVRLYLDEHLVACPNPYGIRLDICDSQFHPS